MTKEQVLLNKSQKGLSMLFNAPTNTLEAVQQDKDVVMRAWQQIHDAMIEYSPSLAEWEEQGKEQVYKSKYHTWTWDKEMYMYATSVVWSENTQFMKGIIDRFMHIDKETFIEYYGRPYEMPFSFEKEYDPCKFVGNVLKDNAKKENAKIIKDHKASFGVYQEVISNQKKTIRNLWWAFGIMFVAWLVMLIA